MAKRYFDSERDYMATFIPDFYEDPDTHDINNKYRMLWNVICGSSIRKVFGTSNIPKTATEEQIQEVKTDIREKIERRYAQLKPKTIGEETEPAE